MSEIEDDLPEEIEVAAPEHVEPVAPSYTPEEADEARTFGWKAPDEWVGDKPAGYIGDPKAYLQRLEKMTPFRTLKERLERQETEFNERTRKLEALSAMQIKSQRDAYDRDMAEIKKQQRAAVELADTEQFDALEARKQSMQPPVVAAPVAPQVDPYVTEYMDKQDWVKNPILRKTGAELIDAAGMNTKPVREQLEYAEREIRKMYPAYFPAGEAAPAPRAPMQQRVDGGGLGVGTQANGFSKLPSEAKAAFARFASEGLYSNNDEGKKAYADQYNAL